MGKSKPRGGEFLTTPSTGTPAPTYTIPNTIGASKSKMTMGVKPKWKPDNVNPGPGQYNGNLDAVRRRTPSAIKMANTKTGQHTFLREAKTAAPDAQYEIMKPFGADVRNKADFGSKY